MTPDIEEDIIEYCEYYSLQSGDYENYEIESNGKKYMVNFTLYRTVEHASFTGDYFRPPDEDEIYYEVEYEIIEEL